MFSLPAPLRRLLDGRRGGRICEVGRPGVRGEGCLPPCVQVAIFCESASESLYEYMRT